MALWFDEATAIAGAYQEDRASQQASSSGRARVAQDRQHVDPTIRDIDGQRLVTGTIPFIGKAQAR